MKQRKKIINSRSVRTSSRENKLIANLGAGSCFGASSFFDVGLYTHQVIENSKTNLLTTDREQVEIEIKHEPPLIRFLVPLLIKRLEVMNALRE